MTNVTNVVKLVWWEQVERWTSTFHGGRAPEVHCFATSSYTSESAVSRMDFSTLFYHNFRKFTFLGFHVIVNTCENLSIDVSITNVRLILTEPRRFLFSKGTDRQTRFWNRHMEIGNMSANTKNLNSKLKING